MNRYILFILLLILALMACKSNSSNSVLKDVGGAHVFQMVQTGALETLDPLSVIYMSDWQIASLCYEGLVGYAVNSTEIVPLISEKWDVFEGGLRYRFKIRENIFFQDAPCFPDGSGKRLTAYDVEYTFDRLLSDNQACANRHLYQGRIKRVIVIDSMQVEFELHHPFASFLQTLASPNAYIIAREAVEFYKDYFSHHPVGTGPFRMVSWRPFESMEWVRHDKYWKRDDSGQRLPYLEKIDILLGGNSSIAYSDFLKGSNWLFRVDERISKNLYNQIYDSLKYNKIRAPVGLTTRFFGFSLDGKSCFAKSANLRRAMALAFGQDFLSDSSRANHVTPAHSFVPPYYLRPANPEWYANDPDSAAFLLRNEPCEPKLKLLSNVESMSVFHLDHCLKPLPFEFEYEIQPTRYFRAIIEDRPDLFRVAFLPSYPDPEDYYGLFYSKSSKDVNLTGYKNKKFDALFEASRIEQNSDKRRDLFLEMEKQLKQDVPALYISHGKPTIYLTPAFVKGLAMRYILLDFSEVSLDKTHENKF